MKKTDYRVKSSSGQQLAVTHYKSGKSALGLVQLLHGMQEHRGRYAEFAGFLAENGFDVLAHDHLGHGESIGKAHPLGDMVSFENVLTDIDIVRRSANFDGRYICFGHSMGSFLARIYAVHSRMDALIACGTGQTPSIQSIAMKIILAFCKRGVPLRGIQMMVLGNLVKEFEKPMDWLSYNNENQAAYVSDPLCGNPFTREGYKALFDILLALNKKEIYRDCAAEKILLISGEKDPVGEFGKSVKKAEKLYREHGKNVRTILYKGMTHEILNETEKLSVYEDILNFLTSD